MKHNGNGLHSIEQIIIANLLLIFIIIVRLPRFCQWKRREWIKPRKGLSREDEGNFQFEHFLKGNESQTFARSGHTEWGKPNGIFFAVMQRWSLWGLLVSAVTVDGQRIFGECRISFD